MERIMENKPKLRVKARGIKIAILVVSAFLIGACSANPAATPNAPAEIPGSFLTLPSADTVALDVSTITREGGMGAMLKAFVDSGGSLAEGIAACADMAEATGATIIDLLTDLSELSVPASYARSNFTGNLTVDGTVHEIKILFTDFDLDGDGTNEGCSGNTKLLPICYRIWDNDVRYLAGVMESAPTDTSAGEGRFRSGGASDTSRGGVIYDHPDSETKTTTFNILDQTEGGDLYFTIHGSIDQVGPDASAVKTLKTASQGMGDPTDLSLPEAQYVGRWQEGEDLWIGSLDMMGESILDNTCATISTAEPAEADSCSALGLDTSGEEYLDFATASDVGFPEDFAETPSF